MLFGLPLVTRRRIHYGPVNPSLSREIFIRAALVQGEYRSNAPFFKHNRALFAELEEMEHQQRRRGIVADEQQLYAFYDERIPAGIYNGPLFERWRKEAERGNSRLLFMTREDLMREGVAVATAGQFPSQIEGLPLSYRFEPGAEDDGATVAVPVVILNQLHPEPFEWLVPGLLREKIIALLKSLPQGLRRNFVPVPQFADACMAALKPNEGALSTVLAICLRKITGVDIPPTAWRPDALPTHLRMNFRVIDSQGKTVAQGRDLTALQQGHRGQAQAAFADLPRNEFGRTGITAWDFGELPEHVEFQRGALHLRGYPALADEQCAVALRLSDTPEAAAQAMTAGLRRLYMLQLPQQIKYLEKNLPGFPAMCLRYHTLGGCESLKQDLIEASVTRAFLNGATPRNQQQFEQRKMQGQARLASTANELCALAGNILVEYAELEKALALKQPPAHHAAVADMRAQLQRLVYPGFVTQTPTDWLIHLPRYLKAMRLRLEKLPRNLERDRQAMSEIIPLWQQYEQRVASPGKGGTGNTALDRYRWMMEELRVSLFAQELRTIAPVSVKRVGRLWEEMGAEILSRKR